MPFDAPLPRVPDRLCAACDRAVLRASPIPEVALLNARVESMDVSHRVVVSQRALQPAVGRTRRQERPATVACARARLRPESLRVDGRTLLLASLACVAVQRRRTEFC